MKKGDAAMFSKSSLRRQTREMGPLPRWNKRTGSAGTHADRMHIPVMAIERARALDHMVTRSLRPVALPGLRVLLGLVFVWFGALKIIGRSPVAGLIARTLPFGHDHLVLVVLGAAEVAIGCLLISGVLLRLALLVLAMHLAGTFATFAMAPGMMFTDGDPLLLTADGEFVAKNGVLIAATLVLIAHSSRSATEPQDQMAVVTDPAP
ncbi:hypothetical protein ACFVTM_13080 [Arthrobacter sp. NPDC058130]|uniref:hypothetical protein n=1 Tax=Arthrobacter sp. NPDC058130 TaxID=3346353 RepID=UPI0036EC0882